MSHQERVLYEAKEAIDELHVVPDGSLWLAVLFEHDSRSRVVSNGQDIGKFDAVQDVTFSSDGRHVAFKVEDNRRHAVVLDGKPNESYLDVNDLVFGPKGLVYRAEIFGKHFIVDAGVEGKKYDEIAGLGVLSDGRVYFTGRVDKEWFIVAGPDEKSRFDRVGRAVFSPDGQRLAYAAQKKKAAFVVLDETALSEFQAVSEPVFLPDASGVAYTAEKDEDAYVVIADETHGPYLKAETPVFAPARQVFLFQRDGTHWVWDSGKEFGPYEVAAYPTFGPDGTLAFVCEFNGKRMLVLNGNPASDRYDEVVSVQVDPVTLGLSFSAREGRQRFMVVNGERQKAYDMVDGFQALPPSSFWYRAKVGRQWRVVIGKEEGPLYDTVGLLGVSSDGHTASYRATRGSQALLVIVAL